jgi:hypothetical protein
MNIGFKVLVTAMVGAFGLAFALPVSAIPNGPPGLLNGPPGLYIACLKHPVKMNNPNCMRVTGFVTTPRGAEV